MVVPLIRFAKSSLLLISVIPATSWTITRAPGELVVEIPCSLPVVVTLAVEAFVIAEIEITFPVNWPSFHNANTFWPVVIPLEESSIRDLLLESYSPPKVVPSKVPSPVAFTTLALGVPDCASDVSEVITVRKSL